MPKFSVIIPTYNRENFVVEAIASILNQSYNDFEIIVIDDGSSDNTRTALEPFGNKLKYIYQDNSGVSAARNAGIKQARGDWIAFLDSDDAWKRDYLARQAGQIETYPDAVAHITDSVYIVPDGEKIVSHFDEIGLSSLFGNNKSLLLKRPFRTIIGHSHWYLQPTVIRRDVLLQTDLLNTELSIAEDIDLLARIGLKGSISISSDRLVEIYRRTEDTVNLSSQFFKRGIYSRKAFGRVYSQLLEMPQLTLLEKLVTAKVLSSTWRALGNVLVISNKKKEARNYYKKALFVYPCIASFLKYLSTFMPRQVSLFLVRKGMNLMPEENVE